MKKFLGLLMVIVFLAAGCGQQDNKVKKISGSIADLLAQNVNLKCELMAQQDGNLMAGTTYIADDQARSDFQVEFAQTTMTSHMINDGTWLYTWSDEFPAQAVKIKLDTMQAEEFETEEAQEQAQNYGLENYQAQLDYKCYDWTKDPAMFVPPTDVNFMDFSQVMEQAQATIEAMQGGQQMPDLINTDKADMCASCDMIPDAQAKESCRQQLGCN